MIFVVSQLKKYTTYVYNTVYHLFSVSCFYDSVPLSCKFAFVYISFLSLFSFPKVRSLFKCSFYQKASCCLQQYHRTQLCQFGNSNNNAQEKIKLPCWPYCL